MRPLLAALLLTAACATHPAPAPTLPPLRPIPLGLNDGFHGLLSADQFAADCPLTIRTPQTSGLALRAFLAASPCPVLALVEAPDVRLVAAFAREQPAAIELGNELELPPFELTPAEYGDWIRVAIAALGNYSGDVVLGGVYAITDETKQAIALGLIACPSCAVGVHLYDASDADLSWLRRLHARVWVTEVGYPTRCDPRRVQGQADYLRTQRARFATVPTIARVFAYQRATGPTCSDLDTFGLGAPAKELWR